jgi:acetoin:2,6-dichlorophenolindophenol oxidoreductase subunit alpha
VNNADEEWTTMRQAASGVGIDLYMVMARIRAADEALQKLVFSGQAVLMLYSPRGNEAVAAGVGAALHIDDYVVTTYRGLHDQIAKGVPLEPLFGEFLGRATGTCKGKGGGMHITHPASGLMVTTGIVGAGIPIANGLALAAQLRGEERVAVCNFGDGASNIGAFHESLNMASVWRLPVVFVCQNNGYAEHTTYAKGTAVDRIVDRAAAYRLPGVFVDGRDPLAVHAVAAEAVARARSGGGPTLIEAQTLRLGGHYVGSAIDYMPAEELAQAQAADPLSVFRSELRSKGTSEDELAAMDTAIQTEVQEAIQAALAAPFADPSESQSDVYAMEAAVK